MPLLLLLAAVPILYASVWIHEIGHVLLGRAAGLVVTSFGLGTGRPLLATRHGFPRAFLCRSHPLQGLTFWFAPHLFPTSAQQAWTLAGGALANAVVAAVFLALAALLDEEAAARSLLLLAAGANSALCLVNLVPMRARVGGATVLSDGARLLRLLRHSPPPGPRVATPFSFLALRSLWEAVGDHTLLCFQTLAAAHAAWRISDADHCRDLLDEAERLVERAVVPHRPFLRAYHDLLAGLGAPLGEVAELWQRAETGFAALGNRNALVVLALCRAQRARDAAALSALSTHSVVLRHPSLASQVLAARIETAAAGQNRAEAERLLARYEQDRRHHTRADDLIVWRAVASLRNGDNEAADAYEEALHALQAIYAALEDAGARTRFLAGHAALIASAQASLGAAGRTQNKMV